MANQSIEQAIALNRFGLGARSDEAAPAAPREWLLQQFKRWQPAPAAYANARTTTQLASETLKTRQTLRTAQSPDDKKAAQTAVNKEAQQIYRDEILMRVSAALDSQTPFLDRLAVFWANHFAVSANGGQIMALAGAFEREAIRPNLLGSFEELLVSVEQHPAMLLFLDQARSEGPNSAVAQRAAKRNGKRKTTVSENLAREILELHTLGVRSGYTQDDVTQFALALTGWSIGSVGPNSANEKAGLFRFRPVMHEPGARTIIGKTYAQEGVDQGLAVLRTVATAEATARHIATKLARHFIADDPPAAAVDRIAKAFLASGGDLPTVYKALIDSPEAWQSEAAKFKTPWDWTISAMRGLGLPAQGRPPTHLLLNQLGQPVWRPGSPAGWDDIAGSWASADTLVRRVEVAQTFASRLSDQFDPRGVAPKILLGSLAEATQREIDRAESPESGVALLLVSPEFQRR